MSSVFVRFTDRDKILEVCRAFLLHRDKQRAPFLATIRRRPGAMWNGWKVTPGGHIIEDHQVLSISALGNDVCISLTNSDV